MCGVPDLAEHRREVEDRADGEDRGEPEVVDLAALAVAASAQLAQEQKQDRRSERREEDREEAHARHAAARAGLIRLNRISQGANVHPVALRDLRKKYEDHLRRWASRDGDQNEGQPPASDNERQATSYRGLRAEMIQAERDEVVTLRDQGRIGDDIMRRIQRDLDLEIMLLEAAEDNAPETPYDLA